RVSHRDLAADEPAGRKRSGRRNDNGVRARAGDTSPGYLRTSESKDLSGTTRTSGGDTERPRQSRNAAVGYTHGGGSTGSACGRTHTRSSIRGRLSGLLVRISPGTQPAPRVA